MDSPEPSRPTCPSSSDPETVNRAQNLQSFPGLVPLPPVFIFPQSKPTLESFSRRAQLPKPPGVKLSREDKTCKAVDIAADGSGISNTESDRRFFPYSEAISSNSSRHDETKSASGSSTIFLADNMKMANQTSANLYVSQSDEILHSSNLLDSDGSVPKLENNNDRTKEEVSVHGLSAISGETEDFCRKMLSTHLKPIETDGKNGYNEESSDLCRNAEPDFPVENGLNFSHHQNYIIENTAASTNVHLVCPSGVQPRLMQNVPEYGHCCNKTAILSKTAENKMQESFKPEAAYSQHGIRQLRYENSRRKILGNGPCSWTQLDNPSSLKSPANLSDSEVSDSSSMDKTVISTTKPLAKTTQVQFYNGNTGSTVKAPKPSGIGLHLNSIVGATQIGSGAGNACLKSSEIGDVSVMSKMSILNDHTNNYSSLSNAVDSILVGTEDGRHDILASPAISSATPLSHHIMKPLDNSPLSSPVEDQSIPCEQREPNFESVNDVESPHRSDMKKKRKTPSDSDGYGCRRCNCKKSQCLKLYCDCFAAGIYCAEPCACQGCFNRKDYEDTVLETRQQIESRNPLAFAPKIIHRSHESPSNIFRDDGNPFTPASARHKRGCNCKKSMCLKKYCECYQANVGCSDGCRCEGCKNVHGKKEEYGLIKHQVREEEDDNIYASIDKLETVAFLNNSLDAELLNPCNLTPLTPAPDCSNYEKATTEYWFRSGRYLSSPESALSFMSSGQSPGSLANNHNMIQKASSNTGELACFGQELDHCSEETAKALSSSWHAGSVSHQASQPSPRDWPYDAGKQQLAKSGYPSASVLDVHSLPLNSYTWTGEIKHEKLESSRREETVDDDTPEILKDSPTGNNVVKISSPSKKRVCPPVSCLQNRSSVSSGGLRNGRKFILQSVPSFPPLTPCIDSKGDESRKTKD